MSTSARNGQVAVTDAIHRACSPGSRVDKWWPGMR
jgi:hypothetical protein